MLKSAWSGGGGGGVCSRGGLPGLGGVCFWGGDLLGPGGGGSPLVEIPPVNRMTNRCKNITLATTSLRPVTSTRSNTNIQ